MNQLLEPTIAKPFKVLGRRLNPFSLWHQILFEVIDCKFRVGCTEKPGYDDLITGAFFCSMDYQTSLKQMSSRTLNLRLKLWGWYCGNFDIPEAAQVFSEYLDHYTEEPKYWFNESGRSEKNNTPIGQFLKVKMMQEFGLSEVQALNTPFSSAQINNLLSLASKGIIRFQDEADYELQKQADAFHEKLMKKREVAVT